jgi:hypothetical protein
MHGAAVVLTAANLPPQGSNFRGQDNRWQVHGVIDGVPYRYGETDPTHLFVANANPADWTGLGAGNAWSVSCVATAPDVRCAIESPPKSGMFGPQRLVVIDDFVCWAAPQSSEMPSGTTITLADGSPCIEAPDPDSVRRDLMAGRTTLDNVSGVGFRQATTLRDWMIRIYKTGRAK